MSESRSSRRDEEGAESVGELPNKQIKLDPVAQIPDSNVKIEDLPDEVIAKILSFLTFDELVEVAQNVCIQWRRVSHDPVLWLNREYWVDRQNTFDPDVMSVLPRVPQLRSLRIVGDIEEAVIQAVCDHCPRLSSLKMAFVKEISTCLLNKLVTNCKNIQTLAISANLLCDEVKAHTLSQLNHLQALSVEGRTETTIHLAPFANKCPLLSKLETPHVNQLCTEDLNELIKANCKTFTHLQLPWTDNNKRFVVPLLTACILLTDLKLFDICNSFGEVLEDFTALRQLTKLRSLVLYFRQIIGGENVPAFKCSSLSQLQVLKIFKCSMQDNALEAICKSFPNLKELHLGYCTGLNDGDFKHLCLLNNIETLELSKCLELTGAALLHVSRVSTLRKLSIEKWDLCELEDGLPLILNMHSLEILSFAYSRLTHSFQFDRIPEMLKNLRILNLTRCGPFTRKYVKPLKQAWPGLLVCDSLILRDEMKRMMRL